MTQPPLWNGEGIDPWLPQRLAAESEITMAERRLYKSWWASLSRWLVKVQRAVFTTGNRVDPHGVYSQAPLWTQLMTAFANGPVRDTLGLGYRKLFGADYRFDARPAVATHLAEVVNRMVRTPEEVFSIIAGEVAFGAGAGESIPDIAARVDQVLSTTATDRWPNRAVVVARTETLGALNAGRSDAFVAAADVIGGEFDQMWLATIDLRTRPAHLEADQSRVPVGQPFVVGGEHLMRPGDPNGSAENVIQCRCTTLLLRPGESVDLSNRGWSAVAAEGPGG